MITWLQLVRVLVQNCVKANQRLYCEGKPLLTTAGHVRANNFAVSLPLTPGVTRADPWFKHNLIN